MNLIVANFLTVMNTSHIAVELYFTSILASYFIYMGQIHDFFC